MAGIEIVDWPARRTLTLRGEPRTLKFPITLRNAGAEPASADLSLSDVRRSPDSSPLREAAVALPFLLAPGQTATIAARLRLDPHTPAGRYRGTAKIAGHDRAVDIEVLERREIVPSPATVTITPAGGGGTLRVRLENRGNTAETIDLSGRHPIQIELGPAPDPIGPAGARKLIAVMERSLGLTRRPLLAPASGSVQLTMTGGPFMLEPGESAEVEIALAMSGGPAPGGRLHVFAPLRGGELHLIIDAAKRPEARRRKRPTAGGTR